MPYPSATFYSALSPEAMRAHLKQFTWQWGACAYRCVTPKETVLRFEPEVNRLYRDGRSYPPIDMTVEETSSGCAVHCRCCMALSVKLVLCFVILMLLVLWWQALPSVGLFSLKSLIGLLISLLFPGAIILIDRRGCRHVLEALRQLLP